MRSHIIALAALCGLVWSSSAIAQIRPGSVEGSIYGGVWEGDAVLETSYTLGGRLGYNLHRIFGVELTYGVVPTTLNDREFNNDTEDGVPITAPVSSSDVTVHQIGLDGILHLSYGELVPYVSAGVGAVVVEDAFFAPNLALGAKYYFTDTWGLRADLRSWLSGSAPAADTLFAHFEATLGITGQFGGDTDMDGDGIANADDQCPGEPEDKDEFEDSDGCPDLDNDGDELLDVDDKCPNDAEDKDGDADEDGCPDVDKDGDGIDDAADKCPDDPEDKDGFEDEDGCPDPDNDNDGVLDGADKCPEPEDKDGFEDADGCPDTDNDQDGILDAADKCPDGAEDKDGFEDEDGCPDPDNDQDGVLDADDKCPDEKETINGKDDEDGCPDKGKSLVSITATRIEIRQKVFFDTGKATIKERSFNLLNQVALILRANSQVTKVRVEGHTDDRGADAFNMKLSQDRADSVKSYLVEKGIDAGRLEAVGYGEDKPVESNKTKKGRDQNRRVEFTILEPPPAGAKTKPADGAEAPAGAKTKPAGN